MSEAIRRKRKDGESETKGVHGVHGLSGEAERRRWAAMEGAEEKPWTEVEEEDGKRSSLSSASRGAVASESPVEPEPESVDDEPGSEPWKEE